MIRNPFLTIAGALWLIGGILRFGAPQTAGDWRTELLRKMDGRAEHFGNLSRQIWEYSEVGYK